MGGEEYWWRKKKVSKRHLKNMPNGWIALQGHKAAIMSDWRFWANKGNRQMSDECRDAVKYIDAVLTDLEACMREHGIGFTKEPNQ
jgi:hypothetical protein